MNRNFLNSNLRHTSLEEEKTFVEEHHGKEQVIHCHRTETIQAAMATSTGRTFTTLGEGEHDDKIEIKKLLFTWSIGDGAWVFTGPFYEIQLKSTCRREDAHAWLEAFYRAEEETNIPPAQKLTHIVGRSQTSNGVVVAARDSRIAWFNIANPARLYITALADATKDSPHPIDVTRMIHHEIASRLQAMSLSPLTPQPSAQSAHTPLKQPPERIMYVPKTIIVGDPASSP